MQFLTQLFAQRVSSAPNPDFTIEAENVPMATLYQKQQCIAQGLAEEAPHIINFAGESYNEQCVNKFLSFDKTSDCSQLINKIKSTNKTCHNLFTNSSDQEVIKNKLTKEVPKAFKKTFKLAQASNNEKGTEKLLSIKQRCKDVQFRSKQEAKIQNKRNVTRDYYYQGL